MHFNRVFHYKPSILGYPYFWKHPYVIVGGLFDDQTCLFLWSNITLKKKTLFGKSLSLFKKSPALRGNSWNFVKKKLVTFRKFHQKKTTKSRLPQRSVRSLKVSSYPVLKKGCHSLPKNPSKTSKSLTWHFELSLRIVGYLYISTHHSFGIEKHRRHQWLLQNNHLIHEDQITLTSLLYHSNHTKSRFVSDPESKSVTSDIRPLASTHQLQIYLP